MEIQDNCGFNTYIVSKCYDERMHNSSFSETAYNFRFEILYIFLPFGESYSTCWHVDEKLELCSLSLCEVI